MDQMNDLTRRDYLTAIVAALVVAPIAYVLLVAWLVAAG